MPVNLIIGIVLIAHGIGHVLGYFPIFGWASVDGWTGESWLLTAPIGVAGANAIALVLWTIPMVGFTLAGLGVLGIAVPTTWIRPLAVVSAVVSIAGIVLFWHAFPTMTNRIGAIAVDIVVLWAVLVAHWPSSDVVAG